MDSSPVFPNPTLAFSLPSLNSWQQLADQIESVLGEKLQAFIEADQRYIVRSLDNYQTTTAESPPGMYLRLRFWENAKEAGAEIRWVKVDYLVLALPLRRQGLGIKIVDLVKSWITLQNSYSFITLYSRPEAAQFWQKCGFRTKDEAYQGKMLFSLVGRNESYITPPPVIL